MINTEVPTKDIGYDLKQPCPDCPFRKNAPYHEGILADLMKFDESISEGKFMFSCHRTDPRSDYGGKMVNGKIQHCAGALAYMANTGRLEKNELFTWAWLTRRVQKNSVKKNREVFGSFLEIVSHYYKGFEKKGKLL